MLEECVERGARRGVLVLGGSFAGLVARGRFRDEVVTLSKQGLAPDVAPPALRAHADP